MCIRDLAEATAGIPGGIAQAMELGRSSPINTITVEGDAETCQPMQQNI